MVEPKNTQPLRAHFPSTHWSMVAGVGHDQTAVRRDAMSRFLRGYMEPLKAHLLCRKRIDPHRADDLLQGFLLSRVLEAQIVSKADRNRGRFRTFLLTALDRFVANESRSARAKKRSPAGAAALADLEDAAESVDSEVSASEAFDIAWAKQVLHEAVKRMHDHCKRTARADLWDVFEGRVLGPTLDQSEPVPYELLMQRHGLRSLEQATNLLATAKRTFSRAMRSVIAEYEEDEGLIDAEIADLRAILAHTRKSG